MQAEYSSALAMPVPDAWVFPGQNAHKAIVIHKTASAGTAQDIARYFIGDTTGKKSVHYIVGQDGVVVQCVLEKDGAGGNCCTEPRYDLFWQPLVQQYTNLNLCTLSIEHCDPSTDNSTPLTDAQKLSSFKLVKYLADKYTIPTSAIKGHNTIAPQTRARCPGNYPWPELLAYLTTYQFSDEEILTWSMIQRLPMTTGIAESWSRAWRTYPHHVFGPPMTEEEQQGSVRVQEFLHARAEWLGGQCTWYDGRGVIGSF